MPKIDYTKLTMDEMRQMRRELDHAMESYEERKRAEAIADAEEALRKHGFTLAEITGSKIKAPKVAKYAHPDDATKTWSGKGRKPYWLQQLLDDGKSLDDLKI